jgi:hypothetical protein
MTDTEAPDPRAWAYAYASRGWRVLPIKPQEKRPPMGRWQDAATTDFATIEMWWTQLYRGHGIGVATGRESGIFVLDVDVAGDKGGDDTLATLENVYGALPDTPTVTTPSGGTHYYFALPDGVEIRNDAGKRLGLGLDIRGEGGQVVAPPTSRAADAYEWVGDTFNLEPAMPPRWMLQRVASDPMPDMRPPIAAQPNASIDDDSPASRFNARTTWAELLGADGWTLAERLDDGEERWVRPGKEAREGISATVGHGGGGQLTVFTSSLVWLPEGSYSRFGYYACRHHGGDRSEAARALRAEDYAEVDAFLEALPMVEAETVVAEVSSANRTELAHIVDWNTFWDWDHSDEDWLAYPLLPKGRAMALYAPAKAGKSTVVLAVAAALATGRPILGHKVAGPATVLYLDYEMTQADLQERLYELGYSHNDDLSRLKYALLPSLPPLDTREGAIAVLELCDLYGVDAVIVDTFGRAVEGEEDHADTVRAFYRHTGLALKARNITYLRTDHSGKDVSKGMRGSSAKNDDVDVVWKLTRVDTDKGGGVKIERTHSRISWVPEELKINRVESEHGFDYILDFKAEVFPTGTAHDMQLLIEAGVNGLMGLRPAREELAKFGIKMGDKRLRPALKMLKGIDPLQHIGTASDAVQKGGTRSPRPNHRDAVVHNRDAADAPSLTCGNDRDAPDSNRDAPSQPPMGRGASPIGGRGDQADSDAELMIPDPSVLGIPDPSLPDLF